MRLLKLWAAAFLLGTFLFKGISVLPNFPLSIFFLITALISVIFSTRTTYSCSFSAIYLGFAWTLCYTHILLATKLPIDLENKDQIISGVIASIPENKSHGVGFEFQTTTAKIKLSWYGEVPKLQVGDRWQLKVRLKRLHGFSNPGGFNSEMNALSHGIHTMGTVRKSVENKCIESNWFSYPIDRIRQSIVDRLDHLNLNSNSVGVIKALIVGVREGITQSQWEALRATGTIHLVVIAGLHVSLISGFIYFCVARLWRLSSYLCLRFPAPKAAALASIFSAIFYAALAGFAIPTQRAIIMIVSFMLCQFMNRHTLPSQSLALALIVVLIWDPLAVFSAGFWLSFAAVSTIAYGMSGRVQLGGVFKKWIRLQMVVSIGVLPFTLLLFQQASIIGLVANFIAVPWVGHVVVPLSLLATLNIQHGLTHALYLAAVRCMDGLWVVIHFLMTLPFSEFAKAIPNPWVFILILIGVLVILAPSGWPSRWVGIFCLLPMGFYPFPKPLHGEVWFHLLDVGQGLSAVVQTENHVLIFDTGPKFSPEFNAGDAVVIPFLRHYGIQTIDTVIISHGDSDHSGGFPSIQKQFSIHRVLTSVPQKFSGSHIYACEQGQQWWWDDVHFEMLYPSLDLLSHKMGNNHSCVLKITIGKNSILLPGDIERVAEQVLIDRVSKQLPSTILIAPHHGSKTSSSYGFVLNVKPRYVLFSVGYLNHFHFPNQEVLARYERLGTQMYQTDKTGTLTLKLTEKEFFGEPESYRVRK